MYFRNGQQTRYEGYCTEVFFSRAMEWMAECHRRGERFFAYLPTNAPHAPLWVPTEDREVVEKHFGTHEHELPLLPARLRHNIIRFLAMIRNLDTQVGRLRRFLAEEDLADNTLLVFMTDNGSTFGHAYYNAGMRGAKCELWEGGHRVPCFMHWPAGGLRQGREVPGLTQVQDILPTLAELCRLDTPAGIDGISLAGCLQGHELPPDDRMLVVNYSRMPGQLDYPTPDSPSWLRREGAAVLWKHWRLLAGTALYDLDTDPLQECNVIDQHPDIARAMQDHLDQWWADVESIANQHQRIIIGSEEENPTRLSACEWADVFVDQQLQVRSGVRKNSYWHLEVARAGEYEFELRRWPRESELGLREGCSETTVTDGLFPAGPALPIARARLFIRGQEHVTPVAPDDQAAVFTLPLEPGPALLHTWFDDERNQPLCGAYYVYVRRMSR